MSIIDNDRDYWRVDVNGEEWLVDGASKRSNKECTSRRA